MFLSCVSQLCPWKSGIKLSSTVISVIESCITLFRRQACSELSPPIPCPAASQQTSWNLWNLYIFITFPQTHTYMKNVPANSFAYSNHFLELIYIRAGVFWGSLVAIWGISHSSNYPFLVTTLQKSFFFGNESQWCGLVKIHLCTSVAQARNLQDDHLHTLIWDWGLG